jgi:NADH:ubiquinone oxidoreductase subunit 5 (subunit L)/multisubunit Na+/H+ antiporter MnhA subunit
MYLNIIFLPLLGSFISGAFGRFLGPLGSGFITFICVLFSLVLSFFAFYEVGFLLSPCFIKLLT